MSLRPIFVEAKLNYNHNSNYYDYNYNYDHDYEYNSGRREGREDI